MIKFNDWKEEARELAAQCWRDEETEHITMTPVLCEAVAERIASWMQTAAQYHKNADYYRDLLIKCGESIGNRAYTADDGTKSHDVLCAKIPEIIASDYTTTTPISITETLATTNIAVSREPAPMKGFKVVINHQGNSTECRYVAETIYQVLDEIKTKHIPKDGMVIVSEETLTTKVLTK